MLNLFFAVIKNMALTKIAKQILPALRYYVPNYTYLPCTMMGLLGAFL